MIRRISLVGMIILSLNQMVEASNQIPLSLNSVTVSPRILTAKAKVELNLQPSKACEADVFIVDRHGGLVCVVAKAAKLTEQAKSFFWDGTDSSGEMVNGDVYYYVVELNDADHQKYIYNPFSETFGKKLEIAGRYDDKSGEIRYELPQSAFVNMRIGVGGGAVLDIPIDWEPQLAGDHKMKWDGKDASGWIWLNQHPGRWIKIAAYSMADNSIIVNRPISKSQQKSREQLVKMPLTNDRYRHALHGGDCKSPKVIIKAKGNFRKNKQGILEVSGVVPIEVELSPLDWQRFENSRYGILFYLDSIPYFKETLGYTPYTYQLDTQKLPNGRHILSVNITTYDDHIGLRSLVLNVNNREGYYAK